ncbi:O-antigen ligase family protein [Paraburkholderia sediminicola]|nr:O-antigen ligase family protein [Paraburkholderia sediminicola]
MNRGLVFSTSAIAWVSAILLFCAPSLNLVWRGATGYAFFLLLALGVATALRRTPDYFVPLLTYRWYSVGMLVFVAAIGVQQATEGDWMPRQFDTLSRFALALPIFLMLRQLPSRKLQAIGWGCTAGALAVGIRAFIDRPQGGWADATRLNNYYTNAIPFGDTALLLAFLSVFSFGWDTRHRWGALMLKLLALLAGGYASYLSGSRGGWLAVPVFVILLGARYGWFAHWKRLLVAGLVMVACAAALLSAQRVQQRIADARSDFALLHQGDTITSTGTRLQLWTASWRLFLNHPVYGIGKGKLNSALDGMASRGEVSTWIINERVHSDFFSTIAEMGAVGVVCLLLFYFGMSIYFWRNRRTDDAVTRAASYSGLAISFSTIIFGLTIDVLVPVMVAALLALLSATLLAMIEARKREIAIGVRLNTSGADA